MNYVRDGKHVGIVKRQYGIFVCLFCSRRRCKISRHNDTFVSLMLEEQPVNFPAPKSYFFKDIEFNADTPIFRTTEHDLVYVKGGRG